MGIDRVGIDRVEIDSDLELIRFGIDRGELRVYQKNVKINKFLLIGLEMIGLEMIELDMIG